MPAGAAHPSSVRRTSGAAHLAALALLGAAACTGDAIGADPLLRISVEGRSERGSVLQLRTLLGGDSIPAAAVRWSVEPAGAADLLPEGRARLLRKGALTLTARYGGRTADLRLQVALPPTILFDMELAGNRDLYRAALDGADLVRLTTSPAADREPTVAGGRIVFVSERDGNAELYSLADGAERRLTRSAAHEGQPALSPDGRRLAFTSTIPELPQLFLAGADASSPRHLTSTLGHGGTLDATPAWSPTGDRLAFMSTANGNPDLYLWREGSGISLLAGGGEAEMEPAWSPDGSRLALVSTRAAGDAELYLLTAATSAVTRVTSREGSDAKPAWLPDGRLVYVVYTGRRPRLVWIDPSAPSEPHEIPLEGAPSNPVYIPR